MQKKSFDLEKRIGKYALVTGAALVATTACKDDSDLGGDNPNVTYRDIADVTLTAPSTDDHFEASFDIDGDGTPDFQIGVGRDIDDPASDYNIVYSYIDSYGSNRVISQSATITYGTNTYTTEFTSALSIGDNIGSNARFREYGYFGFSGVYYGYAVDAPSIFAGKEAFVGLVFDINGSDHYGWMRVDVSSSGGQVVVKDVAFNTVAGESLKAGDI